MKRDKSLRLGLLLLLVAGAVRAEAPPPIGMEDANGQALALEKLDVRLATHGPLALTELELTFRNPLDRQIEGRFTCTLPAGAALSRFAKEVSGQLMEGEVVERLKATQVYTEILHSMRDPALLEADQGNQFKARIFPIPPRGTTRLLIGYSSVVPAAPDGTRTITVPLKGLPRVGEFRLAGVCRPLPGEKVLFEGWLTSVKQEKKGDEVLFRDERVRKDFSPPEDLRLTCKPGEGTPLAHRIQAGDLQMLCFRAPGTPATGPAPAPDQWVVAVDTSASMAGSEPVRTQALEAVLARLAAGPSAAPLVGYGFDLGIAPLAGTTPAALAAAVKARRSLGATDLGKALAKLGDAAREGASRRTFVLVSDGIATMGPRDAGALVKALGAWPANATLHVLVLGATWDESVCRALAEAGRGRVVQVALTEGWAEHVGEGVEGLTRPVGSTLTVSDQAAEWLEPAELRDVAPGTECVVFEQLRARVPSRPMLAVGTGAAAELASEALEVPAFAPLLSREAFHAYLGLLERQEDGTDDPEQKAKLKARRLELSVGKRVVCPLTSMLVLESEADYQRFGIDRRALAEILVVTDHGIASIKREPVDLPAPPVRISDTKTKDHARKANKASPQGTLREGFQAVRGEESGVRSAMAQAPGGAETDELGVDDAPTGAGAPAAAPADTFSASMDANGAAPEPPDTEAPESGSGTTGMRAGGAPMPDARPSAPPPPRPVVAPASGGVALQREIAAQRRIASSRVAYDAGRGGGDSGDLGLDGEGGGEGSEGGNDGQQTRRHGKFQAPGWVAQSKLRPEAKELAELAAKIKATPQDRGLRNKLCWYLLRLGEATRLAEEAWAWQPFDPVNPMVYEYLAEAFHAQGDEDGALRALSSIAEVSPTDSGLLNRAGYLALRAGEAAMAESLFRVALERRPDHANNYRGLALALWSEGKHAAAVGALEEALKQHFNPRYGNVERILREEISMVLQGWGLAHPEDAGKIKDAAASNHCPASYDAPLRFTLHWETDANDVDLHVVDPAGEECFYSHKQNASGLNLYEDLTQGLGPETASVPAGSRMPGVYHVGVKYFSAGPMGVSRGVVVIQRPSADGSPKATIQTFTLLPDVAEGQDMRHVAVVE